MASSVTIVVHHTPLSEDVTVQYDYQTFILGLLALHFVHDLDLHTLLSVHGHHAVSHGRLTQSLTTILATTHQSFSE